MSLSKKLAKLTDTVLEEIFALHDNNPAGLHKVVSDSEAAIIQATKARDANVEYQKAGETRKEFTASLNDLKKYQKAKAALALALLDRETLSDEDEEAIDKAQRRAFDSTKNRIKGESA